MYAQAPSAYRAQMSAGQPRRASDEGSALHIATIAHAGVIWDAYLELDDDPRQPTSFRARLRFDQDGTEDLPASTQTAAIIIEESYEDAVGKARAFDDRQLQALLRSTLPETA